MDERDDYADADRVPTWEPTPATVIVFGFAALVVVGCGIFAVFFGYLLGGFW
jgi:hypothetical protein